MHDKTPVDEQSTLPKLRTLNYRLYTMDGKFEEVARGQLHLEFGPGANNELPITGIEMSMEGSGKTDPVLIPSLYREPSQQIHVRLKGDGRAVNSVYGNLTRMLRWSQPIQLAAEYRHVGQPFGEILGEDWRYLFMLAVQEDAVASADADERVDDPHETGLHSQPPVR